MTLWVALLGTLFLGISLAVLASPRASRWPLRNLVTPRTLPLFAIVRIGFGIACVLAAPSTRLPGFVWALGLLLIASGVSLPLVGFERVRRWADWWLEKPDREYRAWSRVGILLGALLLWAAI